MIGLRRDETEHVAAAVAQMVPPALVPLFDRRFTRSHMLFDEYVFRLVLRVFAGVENDAVAERKWNLCF